jgi:uncharacterized membrane protein YjjP (DUF1212 family)
VTGGLLVTALVVLVATAWIGWHFVRRWRTTGEDAVPTTGGAARRTPVSSADLVALLSELGAALNAAGEPVGQISRRLRVTAAAYGAPDAELVVFPNALLVQLAGQEQGMVGMATRLTDPMRLDQITDLFRLATRVTRAEVEIVDARRELRRIWSMHHRLRPAIEVLGHGVSSAGLVLILAPSLTNMLAGLVLGSAVGALKLWRPVQASVTALMPVIGAFGVAVVALVAVRHGLRVDPVAVLIAPLVTFIPGAALTTATIELSDGQMVAGAARLVQGGLQLVLLGFGIVAGAGLVSISGIEAPPVPGGGPWRAAAPFLGVFLFAVGMFVHRSGARGAFGWTLLVLYVAYSAQVVGAATLGGYLSGFVGAAVMTPVAMLVAAQPGGPPLMATFLPAFWLLVPGSMGLIGVAQILATQSAGDGTLLSAGVSIVAIALGVITGLGVAAAIDRRQAPVSVSAPT